MCLWFLCSPDVPVFVFSVLLLVLHLFLMLLFSCLLSASFCGLFCMLQSWVVFSCSIGGVIMIVISGWIAFGPSLFGSVSSYIFASVFGECFVLGGYFLLRLVEFVGVRLVAFAQWFALCFLLIFPSAVVFRFFRHPFRYLEVFHFTTAP